MQKKSILITGCSSGIGLAAAQDLHNCGYRVFASARKLEDVEKLQNLGLETIQLDVNQPHTIEAAIAYIYTKTNGTLNALFNNAGYMQTGAIEDLTLEQIRQQFETNVFGAMALTKAVLPLMRKQGYGRIVQNSSILGVITLPFYGAYNASKFALEGFSRTLRQELRGSKIFVSILNPGPIKSALRDNAYVHFQNTIKPTQAYSQRYTKMETSYFQNREKSYGDDPSKVIKKLKHALTDRHPKIHYYVGTPAQSLAALQRLLPERMMDWVLAKFSY